MSTTICPRSHIKRLDRKTICFSCSVEIHEKVIGSFIEKTYSADWSHHPEINVN
ncbi:hypothetical protein HMPREF1602_04145 [Escherichia coli 907889]|nr:insertion element iso-IS1n insB domain protein [Escherichia coli 3431]ESD35036.1 hypothetical protein HMPREF1602_04145 [Escherichia coli 907889]